MSLFDSTQELKSPGWRKLFLEYENDLLHISQQLTGIEYYPLRENIFKAFELTPLEQLKVVIVGQDCYYSENSDGTPTAIGLAFDIGDNKKIPGTLKNIYKEIKNNYPDYKIPENGNLSSWAKQGILMINMSLTVLPGKANSHNKLWNKLITAILTKIAMFTEKKKSIIFVLWGSVAQKIIPKIPMATILKTSHPSGNSAFRGFIGCGHFKQINDILLERKEKIIIW